MRLQKFVDDPPARASPTSPTWPCAAQKKTRASGKQILLTAYYIWPQFANLKSFACRHTGGAAISFRLPLNSRASCDLRTGGAGTHFTRTYARQHALTHTHTPICRRATAAAAGEINTIFDTPQTAARPGQTRRVQTKRIARTNGGRRLTVTPSSSTVACGALRVVIIIFIATFIKVD